MEPTLVILAAGMASRYGSMKQIQSFGPGGERVAYARCCKSLWYEIAFHNTRRLQKKKTVMKSYSRFANCLETFTSCRKAEPVNQELEAVKPYFNL